MRSAERLQEARAAFERREWAAARAAYAEAGDLAATDLEAWGLAAGLTGHDDEADRAREQAHRAHLADGDPDGAARVAFWLGLSLLMRGEPAQGGGWFGRMRSAVGEAFPSSVWAGYDAVTQGMAALFSGDGERSLRLLAEGLDIAARHDDTDLRLLAGSGHGQALLAVGRSAEGMAELDEVMVTATSADASPQVVGRVYCAVIAVCRGCLDLARSAEWTEVLGRWCDSQPDLVPFRGQCLVHRSEVLQVRGQWDDAALEVEKVLGRRAPATGDAATGMALYQRAELHRLRGDFRAADGAYREALAAGQDPQPGLALLRLAQGRADSALLALTRALAETRVDFLRARLLPALVEVALGVGDLPAARSAAGELAGLAERLDSAYGRAVAATAGAAVAIAEGEPGAALGPLRSAVDAWGRLDAPYEGARCRLLLARACRALGDDDTADLETDAARQAFADLGAKHDLDLLDDGRAPAAPAGLTPRELEVLRLVATGASNRDIAERLVLSERTVARHVANIFVKIGVSARSAATAYAYDQRLL